VLEAARSIGYRGPDPRGRMLSAGKVNAIGVATVEPLSYFFTDPFARVLMAAITEECDASGVGVSLVSAASQEELAWNMGSALVDGFILFCLEGADRLIELSKERQLPFVALAFGHRDATISVVGIDNVGGAAAAARHLAELGHRRFAILAMEFHPGGSGKATMQRVEGAMFRDSSDRVQGYLEALAGFGVDTGSVPIYETLSDRETVAAALEEVFAAPAPPTALLAESDRIAFHAIDWLKARGLSVPGDVSVVGFDGVPESATSNPPLTTVQQPIAEIGRRAVRVILDHSGEVWREKLAVELVVRDSTAPPPDRAAT
jgi:DNA-binding LacI/PurR family transcriptional regulator